MENIQQQVEMATQILVFAQSIYTWAPTLNVRPLRFDARLNLQESRMAVSKSARENIY